jgi:hypothetical protein
MELPFVFSDPTTERIIYDEAISVIVRSACLRVLRFRARPDGHRTLLRLDVAK